MKIIAILASVLVVAGSVACTKIEDRRPPADQAQYTKMTDTIGYGLHKTYDHEEANVCYVYSDSRGTALNCMVSLQASGTKPQ